MLETLPDEVYCIATGLNNARQICGYSQNQNRQNSPVTWDVSGGAAKSLASPVGAAIAVNAKGVVVGSLKGHAALWKDRTLQDLGVPDGASSAQAFGINAKGDVVGGGIDGAKNPLPWSVDMSGTAIPLEDTLDPNNPNYMIFSDQAPLTAVGFQLTPTCQGTAGKVNTYTGYAQLFQRLLGFTPRYKFVAQPECWEHVSLPYFTTEDLTDWTWVTVTPI